MVEETFSLGYNNRRRQTDSTLMQINDLPRLYLDTNEA